MMKKILSTALFMAAVLCASAKDYTLTSPDGHLTVSISTGDSFTYSLSRDGKTLIAPSTIGLTLSDGSVWGPGTRFAKAQRRSVDQQYEATLFKRSTVRDNYNELELKARNFSVSFRAYDDGIAYRFNPNQAVTIADEQATFAFAQDWPAYIPYVCQNTETLESQFHNSFEAQYNHHVLSAWNTERLGFLPMTVEADGALLCVVESDLLDYPGMFLYNDTASPVLHGVFAPVPDQTHQGGYINLQRIVDTRKDVIAENTAVLPWRGIIVATEDKDLAQSDFTWRLATPADGRDWSWVKPGKVAWDWWNAWNIYGVDFESGVNNETYKYYIDFASKAGIEYVILDDGWTVGTTADLMQVVPEIDMPMLVDYAASKGVGLILWAGHMSFNRDMEAICRHYSEMGIKGWKIDFMDHDDQDIVQFYCKAAETAAKYHMVVDFHGSFKPAGLQRTFPNVLNFEGVYGLENMKWGKPDVDQVTYDVTIPYTRLVAGPADYTQGAMRNATRDNYRPVGTEAMSQGTRCHQLAEYVIFDAPLTMLCDAPTNYMNEPECTEFIAGIPTVWDETVAVDGKIGEYVVLARRKGDRWYVGALNGWTPRDLTLDLSFIPEGQAVVFADGVNAHRVARDYKRSEIDFTGTVNIHLAPGGGWVLER